jgi:hypothetical protein
MKTKKCQFLNRASSTKVIVSHGGGLGGAHIEYFAFDGVKVEGTVVSFVGYANLLWSEHDINVIAPDGVLLSFNHGAWPAHRIENLRSALARGDMEAAGSEYRATDAKNKPTVRPRVNVQACCNWLVVEFAK